MITNKPAGSASVMMGCYNLQCVYICTFAPWLFWISAIINE